MRGLPPGPRARQAPARARPAPRHVLRAPVAARSSTAARSATWLQGRLLARRSPARAGPAAVCSDCSRSASWAACSRSCSSECSTRMPTALASSAADAARNEPPTRHIAIAARVCESGFQRVRLINPHVRGKRGRIIAARLIVARHSSLLAMKRSFAPGGPQDLPKRQSLTSSPSAADARKLHRNSPATSIAATRRNADEMATRAASRTPAVRIATHATASPTRSDDAQRRTGRFSDQLRSQDQQAIGLTPSANQSFPEGATSASRLECVPPLRRS